MKTCKTCDFWVRLGPAPLNKDTQYFGVCENDEKLRALNPYDDLQAWEKAMLFVDAESCWNIYTGEDFGCIHWTREDEDGSTCEAT